MIGKLVAALIVRLGGPRPSTRRRRRLRTQATKTAVRTDAHEARDAAAAVARLREYEAHVKRWQEARRTFSPAKLAEKQNHLRGLVAAARRARLDVEGLSVRSYRARIAGAPGIHALSNSCYRKGSSGQQPGEGTLSAKTCAPGASDSHFARRNAASEADAGTQASGARGVDVSQSGDGVRAAGGSRDHIAAHLSREGQIEDGVAQGWRDVDPNQGHPTFDDWSAVVDDGLHDI